MAAKHSDDFVMESKQNDTLMAANDDLLLIDLQRFSSKYSFLPNFLRRKQLQKKVFLPKNSWSGENELIRSLKLYWQRRRIFKRILTTYQYGINDNKTKSSFFKKSHNFEQLMKTRMNSINEKILFGQERNYFVATRNAFNKIIAKRQMQTINNFMQDDSEVRNNVKRINHLIQLIFKTEKKLKSSSKSPKYILKVETYSKLHSSQMTELFNTCSHLKNILNSSFEQATIGELIKRINCEYEKSLLFSIKEIQLITRSNQSMNNTRKYVNSNLRNADNITKIFDDHHHKSWNCVNNPESITGDENDFHEVYDSLEQNRNKKIPYKNNNYYDNNDEDDEMHKFISKQNTNTLPAFMNRTKKNSNYMKNPIENLLCSALCDYDGEGNFLPMVEGQLIKIVRRDSGGMFAYDVDGSEKPINTKLVNMIK